MSFRPIRDYKAPGRYPSTEYQLRHLYRNRKQNGLDAAFSRAGNRVLFDPEHLQRLLGGDTTRPKPTPPPTPPTDQMAQALAAFAELLADALLRKLTPTQRVNGRLGEVMSLRAFAKQHPDLATEGALRWWIHQRENNGIVRSGALVKRAGRWFVVAPKMHDWILSGDSGRHTSAPAAPARRRGRPRNT